MTTFRTNFEFAILDDNSMKSGDPNSGYNDDIISTDNNEDGNIIGTVSNIIMDRRYSIVIYKVLQEILSD